METAPHSPARAPAPGRRPALLRTLLRALAFLTLPLLPLPGFGIWSLPAPLGAAPQEPVTEAPVTEAPVIEDPAIEDPVTETPVVQDRTEVAILDVMVDVVPGIRRRGDEAPRGLAPGDLTVTVGGRPAAVIGIETPEDGEGSEEIPEGGSATPAEHGTDEHWTVLIHVDAALADDPTLRFAADALAERAEALVDLGAVSVVVADPEPRSFLAPTRDPARLREALARLAFFTRSESRVTALRQDFLAVVEDPQVEASPEEIARVALGQELALTRRSRDALLTTLADLSEGPAAASPRRAVLLVGGGHDLEPELFYGVSHGVSHGISQGVSAGEGGRATAGDDPEALARAAAAAGWAVFPLLAPPPGDPLRPGVRIGKLRLQHFGPLFLGGTWEEDRDPEKGEAYLALGRARIGAEEWPEAAKALRRSILHFAGDPATAILQAEAWDLLGEAYHAQELPDAARRAWQIALELDPTRQARSSVLAAVSGASRPLLELLAEETGGRPVDGPEALDEALVSLGRRSRLTLQLAEPGDPAAAAGVPEPLDVQVAGGRTARLRLAVVAAPRWVRFGPLEAVARARLRRLLIGTDGPRTAPADSPLPSVLQGLETTVDAAGRLTLTVPRNASGGGEEVASPPRLRITLGTLGPPPHPALDQGAPVLAPAFPVDPSPTEGSGWEARVTPPPPPAGTAGWTALLVEDLDSGAWVAGWL